MLLFCLPYAGGAETIYYNWKNYLHPSIQLVPIELKGRGKRFNEIFYESLEEAVEDIFDNIREKIVSDDYAIFGHSMGSLLSYELYYKINQMGLERPKHMFLSGHRAPSIIKEKENIHALPECDFIRKVMNFGGTPEELINNEELLEIFIPILRNDFKIVENYKYKQRENNIECNVSIFNGKQDSINLEETLTWKKHVNRNFKVYNFEGNHFFINANIKNITNIINETLCSQNFDKRDNYK